MVQKVRQIITVTIHRLMKVLLRKRNLLTPESRSYATKQQVFCRCVNSTIVTTVPLAKGTVTRNTFTEDKICKSREHRKVVKI